MPAQGRPRRSLLILMMPLALTAPLLARAERPFLSSNSAEPHYQTPHFQNPHFQNPIIESSDGHRYRLDRCLHWETLCECAAAREFCRQNGFPRLRRFEIARNVFGRLKQKTAIIGDAGVLCPDHAPPHVCDSFSIIVCANDGDDDLSQCGGEKRVAPLAAPSWVPARSTPAVRPGSSEPPTSESDAGSAEAVDFEAPSKPPLPPTPALLPPPLLLPTPNQSPDSAPANRQ